MTRDLPTGTVTFLFTDIEGSTNLVRTLGHRWADVVKEHNDILRRAIADRGGALSGRRETPSSPFSPPL